MDRLLDLDEQPPYLEVYKHAPIMYMTFCDFEAAAQGVHPKEWLVWVHSVQSAIDVIAAMHGLYKVKAYAQGRSCLFSISPDTPPKEQAAIMLSSAQQMMQALRQHQTPGGQQLSMEITIHAGQYAGGIVGKSAWTYDLFGDEVNVLLAMAAHNTPNNIQLTAEALKLVGDRAQFVATPVLGTDQEVLLLYTLKQEAAAEEEVLPATSMREPELRTCGDDGDCSAGPNPCASCTTITRSSPSNCLAAVNCTCGDGASSSSGSLQQPDFYQRPLALHELPQDQRSDLRFAEPRLEAAYRDHHDTELACMDAVFILVSLLVAGACWLSLSRQLPRDAALIAHTALLCLVPLISAVLWHRSPARFYAWREGLWAAHRVLVVADLCSPYILSFEGAAGGGALAMRLLRFGTLAMLVDALGFKVRFSVHCLVMGINMATVVGAMAYMAAIGNWSIGGLDVGLRLLLGAVIPALLVYDWERDHRASFLADLDPGAKPLPFRNKAKAA